MTRGRRGATPTRGARPRRGSQARRPGRPMRTRIGPHLPSRGRLAAALIAAALIAAFAVVVTGPWLRVTSVAWSGRALTAERALRGAAEGLEGQNALLVDGADLRARLQSLPAVAAARVDVQLPDRVAISLTEEAPAFVWRTRAVQLIGAADGTLIGQLALGDELEGPFAALPVVDDRRPASGDLTVGDRVDPEEVAIAIRLAQLEPAALGSTTSGVTVHLEPEYGFVVDSAAPAWRAAFGLYGMDPEIDGDVTSRIERQVAGVRTLFAEEDEATIGWLDVRNPGRVYWRPRG